MAYNINKSDPGTTLPKQQIVKEGGEEKNNNKGYLKASCATRKCTKCG